MQVVVFLGFIKVTDLFLCIKDHTAEWNSLRLITHNGLC